MPRKDKIEKVAQFLNRLCVDHPPIAYSWESKGQEFARRRKWMRELATQIVTMIED